MKELGLSIRNNAAWSIAIALEIILSLWIQTVIPHDGDIGIHVNTARRILRGQQLYCDIYNVGFPIQFYMRIPGVWAAEWLNLSYMNVAIVFDNIMALFSFALCMLAIKDVNFMRNAPMAGLVPLSLAFVLFVYPAIDSFTGEKEYFYWIYTIPYFLVSGARSLGITFSRRFLIIVGIGAALGFAYKPFFILTLLIVEVYMLYLHRSWKIILRPEAAYCIAVWAGYMLWFLLAFPCYNTIIYPLLKYYYYLSTSDYLEMFDQHYIKLIPFLLVIIGITHPLFRKGAPKPFFTICILALAGYTLTTIMQMQAYYHHFYPVISMAIFTCALMIAALEKEYEEKRS